MMVMAALFMVSSIFYLLAMLCNLFVTFGCNCLQCLCCKCGDGMGLLEFKPYFRSNRMWSNLAGFNIFDPTWAICDNVCLLFFFILGVAYIVLCFIFDIVLIKSAWGFVFHTAKGKPGHELFLTWAIKWPEIDCYTAGWNSLLESDHSLNELNRFVSIN